MAFLFTVICALPKASSAALPVIFFARKSTKNTWLSVRPEIIRKPRFTNSSAIAAAFTFTCLAYSLNSGSKASLNATALAAITCIKGPPCRLGKIAEFKAFSCVLSRHKITPPRGPRKVLCVVVVTKSAKGTGLGYSPPATKPA